MNIIQGRKGVIHDEAFSRMIKSPLCTKADFDTLVKGLASLRRGMWAIKH